MLILNLSSQNLRELIVPHIIFARPLSLITTDAEALGVARGIRKQNKWHITSCQAGKRTDKSAEMHGCSVYTFARSAPYAEGS